jgi:hypothetical protein
VVLALQRPRVARDIGILQRWFPWHGLADRLIRGAVVGTAVVVFCGLVLGGIGWLGRAPCDRLAVLAAGAQFAKGGRSRASRITVANIPWPAVAFCSAILTVVISFGLSHSR